MRTKTHFHNGVEITEVIYGSKSYFYPAFNGNVEFTSLEAIHKWIDGTYHFVRAQCDWLGEQMGISGNKVFNFINNLST